jgi:hypothetical protein
MTRTAPTNRSQVRRRHPARRARRITAVASVAGMGLLTGCMTTGTTSSSSGSSSGAATATQSTAKATATAAAATPSAAASTTSQGS